MDLFEDQDDNELIDNGENLELSNENIEETNGEDKGSGDEEKKTVKPKRVVKNPRAKLDAELLKGPKGLGNLEKCFERVQFKGHGYEEQDLNVLLKTYEYWCHRLFPKYPFKDCIEKIEKLGSKGPIQTYLKKVRSGLVDNDNETPEALPDFQSDDDQPGPSTDVQQSSQYSVADIPIELTEEQLETIRRNREKAEKLRQERLRRIQEKASLNLPEKTGDERVVPSLVQDEGISNNNSCNEEVANENNIETPNIEEENDRIHNQNNSHDSIETNSNNHGDLDTNNHNNDSRNQNDIGGNNHDDSDSNSEFGSFISKRKSKNKLLDDEEEDGIEKGVGDSQEESDSNISKKNDIVEEMEVDH